MAVKAPGMALLIGVDPGPLAGRVQADNYAVIGTLGAAWPPALGANLVAPEEGRNRTVVLAALP